MFSSIRSLWVVLLTLTLPPLLQAIPVRVVPEPSVVRKEAIALPIQRRRAVKGGLLERDDGLTGSVGIGDVADLFYTVTVQLGNTTTAVNLDTGSSDLWVMSNACQTSTCQASTAVPYTSGNGQATGASVSLRYGDSTSGTHASGPVLLDTVGVAGLSMQNQAFAAVNDTDNSAVQNGGAGIFGLGFPTQSFVQSAVVNEMFNTPTSTDAFVSHIASLGPLVARLAMSGHIEQPIFAITLQRNTIDIGGHGQITIGELPPGVDNSSLTWVPVRLYSSGDGGLNPPSFALNEVYPLRWEIPLDAVYLDGQQLPDTGMTGASPQLSALVDTGNSIIRGPQDVTTQILSSVSPQFAATSNPTLPCSSAHTLAFKIGGQLFPIDPRDFISPSPNGDATTCLANNVVATDPPSRGALFSWSLGDPFFKSNLVVFYYGNLTHPSVDPPRIGFMSNVPQNATALLQEAVQQAQEDGGAFESTSNIAPTASTVTTIVTSPPTAVVSPQAFQDAAPTATLQASPDKQASISSTVPSPSPTQRQHSSALAGRVVSYIWLLSLTSILLL